MQGLGEAAATGSCAYDREDDVADALGGQVLFDVPDQPHDQADRIVCSAANCPAARLPLRTGSGGTHHPVLVEVGFAGLETPTLWWNDRTLHFCFPPR